MTEHARIQPSSLKRTVACTASFKVCEGARQYGDDTASEEGTAAHALAENWLNGRIDPVPNVTEEMRELVRGYVKYCESLGGEGHVEEKVYVKTIHEDCYGTPDYWTLVDNVLHVVDLKYGFRWVGVQDNPQLIAYAGGILLSKIEQPSSIREIKLHIYQPRGHHHDGPARTQTLKATSEFMPRLTHIRDQVKIALSDDATFSTGPHCYKCPRLHDCHAAREASYNAIDISTASSDLTEMDINHCGHDLILIDRAMSMLKDRATQLEEVIKYKMNSGEISTTHEQQNKLGKRKWIDEDRARLSGQLAGVNMEKSVLLSPAQAEKKGLSKKTIGGLTTRPSYTKLAPINHDEIKRKFKND